MVTLLAIELDVLAAMTPSPHAPAWRIPPRRYAAWAR